MARESGGSAGHTHGGHLQNDGGQVGAENFRIGVERTGLEVLLGVQPDGDAVRDAAAAPGALVGRCLGHALDGQPLHFGAVRVARDARGAGVDDVLDARHGQGGLGHVGGQHNPPLAARVEHPVLLLQAQPREQGEDLGAGEPPVGLDPGLQGIGGVPDLALAGEEDQDVARRFKCEFIDGVAHGVQRVAVFLEFIVGGVVLVIAGRAAGRLRERPVADLHRERASGHFDDGCRFLVRAEVLGKTLGIDRGGGDDHLQVRPLRQDPLEVAEDEVDVEAAFVGLIDDDRVVFAEQLVALDLGQQDAVGHQLDLGGLAHLAGEADLEAHFLPDVDAEFGGDAFGHRPGGEPARLGVADQAVLAQAQLQAHLGNLGGLSGTGLTGDDRHLVGGDRGHQVLAALGNRQLGGVGDVKSHGSSKSTAA
jgi:hypothetical protein